MLIFRRGICNAYLLFEWLARDQEELVIIEAVSDKYQQLTVPFQEKKNDLSKGKENYRSKRICWIAQENYFSWKFEFRLKIFKDILHEPNLCTQIRV